MAIIDMIIARQDEEIRDAQNFLTMLAQQRYANFGDIAVTFIQMGNDQNGVSELKRISEGMPFKVNVVGTEHTSLAKTYNLGIESAKAEWIMFSKYGDMFCDIYALKMILALLPTDEFDLLWMEYYTEFSTTKTNGYINITSEADNTINAKLFRRAFLIEQKLRFDESLKHDEGTVFINLVISKVVFDRFAKINTKFIPYTHDEIKIDQQSEFEQIRRVHETNMAIINNIKHYDGNSDKYIEAVINAICCGFYFMHFDKKYPGLDRINAEIGRLYRQNRKYVDPLKPQDIEIFLHEAYNRMLSLIQEAYRKYGYEMYFDAEDVSFTDWLKKYLTIEEKEASPF